MPSTAIDCPKEDELPELVAIWESAVRATHDFLEEEDIQLLKPLIGYQYLPKVELLCSRDDQGHITGFLGYAGDRVEMLFIAPVWHGRGIGKSLMQRAIALGMDKVDVNEQNPGALEFYRKQGFDVISRSPLDGSGRPFPILHLQLRDPSRVDG